MRAVGGEGRANAPAASRGPEAGVVAQTPTPQHFSAERVCPWCGSRDTRLVPRGYAGPTDAVDQYFTCDNCGKITYEMVAKTAREMRLGRFRAGGVYQDRAHRTRYHVSRILKVGVNEYLLYLKPLAAEEPAPAAAVKQ